MGEVISGLGVFVVVGVKPVVLRWTVGCRERPHERLFACLFRTLDQPNNAHKKQR